MKTLKVKAVKLIRHYFWILEDDVELTMGGDGALTALTAPWMAVPSLRQCKQSRQPRKALFNITVAKGQLHLGPQTGELQRWHGGCCHPSPLQELHAPVTMVRTWNLRRPLSGCSELGNGGCWAAKGSRKARDFRSWKMGAVFTCFKPCVSLDSWARQSDLCVPLCSSEWDSCQWHPSL